MGANEKVDAIFHPSPHGDAIRKIVQAYDQAVLDSAKDMFVQDHADTYVMDTAGVLHRYGWEDTTDKVRADYVHYAACRAQARADVAARTGNQ